MIGTATSNRRVIDRSLRSQSWLTLLCLLAACGGDDASSGSDSDAMVAGTGAAGAVGAAGTIAGSAGAVAADSVGAAGSIGKLAAGSGGGAGRAGAGAAAGAAAGAGAGAGGMVGAARTSVMGGAGGSAGSAGNPGVPALRWVGRVDASDPNAVKFAWQGAGFVANVQGTTIAVKLRTEGTDTVFFQPVIDGKPATRFEVKSGSDRTLTLGSGLAAGNHVVELYRETEGMYGVSTFLGLTSGALMAPPASSGRLIEVVGDSISAGYGNLGSEPHPAPDWAASPACHWTAANSSWYQTYASVAGHKLDAEVSTIARSGWGMYRDGDGNTSGVLSALYDHALGTAAQPSFNFQPKASAVVINLGTNDWAKGDPGKPYEDAYVAFLEHVRSDYPNAFIFLTIGSMLSDPSLGQVKTRLQAVVAARAAAGDDKIVTFDLGTQPLGANGEVPTGCDWHPNAADHARMAGILETQLKAKLGW
jgi:lysophospholipase L1-like esterase